MSHYSKKDFKGCLFDPMTEGRMTDAFPNIWEVIPQEIGRQVDIDNLLRYMVMVYDPKSPVVLGERDLNYRKSVAADLSNLPTKNEAVMESIYLCTYPGIVEMTCKFLVRFVRSREWAAIVAYEYKFWEALRLIMQPISTDKSDREQLDAASKKDVLSASIDEGIVKLERYYKVFFGEDDELERKAKKRMTPELMARKEG